MVTNTQFCIKLGAHIRRKHPLPEWDKSVYSRTILVARFKEKDIVTVSSVGEVFEVCHYFLHY